MEVVFRILKGALQKLSGQHRRGSHPPLFTQRCRAETLLLSGEEVLPGPQQIIGGKPVALFDEESHRRLPDGPEIEDTSAGNVADQPEEFLQTVGDARVAGGAGGNGRARLRHPSTRRSRGGGAGAGGSSFGRPIHRRFYSESALAATLSSSFATRVAGVAREDPRDCPAGGIVSTLPRSLAPSSMAIRGVITLPV